MKNLLICFLLLSNVNISWSQCLVGEVEIIVNTGGGVTNDIWINITTGVNGTGTVIWAQGNGTIGNGEGALTNQSICVPEGIDFYINTFDQYDDSWEGSTYTITSGGLVVANNGGISPDDGNNDDGSSSWQSGTIDLETTEQFQANSVYDMTTISDICVDDNPFIIEPITPFNPNSGKAGLAIILVTDDFASEITFDIEDWDGVDFIDETNFAGAPPSLANNTTYLLYDNPCFDVTETSMIPKVVSARGGANGVEETSSIINGCGIYIYYYASDGIEVVNNKAANATTGQYITPGTNGFPSFYTASTNKRSPTIPSWYNHYTKNIWLPVPAEYEYFSSGEWNGTALTNVGTESKEYFSPFPGIATTVTVPSGYAEFDPSSAPIGPNLPQTFTYNSVMGVNGPAPCNVQTVTDTELDVHALPVAIPVEDQDCIGPTYDVTVNINLGTYNVSVDEDGGTPFNVTATGGTVSPSTLTGTGIVQVTISNIPIGTGWTLNVEDVTGINCGLTGVNGNCATVLPIELLSFTGKNKNEVNQLNWSTLSESNNDYFIIEKSKDGEIFIEIDGYIDGAGFSNQIISYSRIDDTPFSLTYYRLKQVDFDGHFSYSNVIALENKHQFFNEFHLFPNPTSNNLTIQNNSRVDLNASFILTNSIGKVIMNGTMEFLSSRNHKNVLSLDGLQRGVYFVTICTNEQEQTYKIIKE